MINLNVVAGPRQAPGWMKAQMVSVRLLECGRMAVQRAVHPVYVAAYRELTTDPPGNLPAEPTGPGWRTSEGATLRRDDGAMFDYMTFPDFPGRWVRDA